MKTDLPEAHDQDESFDDDDLPEFHPSALRTGIFRVLTGLSCLLMGWVLWHSFSWGRLLVFLPVALYFIPFTLRGYEGQVFIDAIADFVGRIVYHGVPKSTSQPDPLELIFRQECNPQSEVRHG